MANIYEVATAARVSVATVSAVVNGTAYVSPGLTARVQAAVKQLGYQPNLVARSLATQQSRTIGMIVPNIANPFWPAVVRGVEDAAVSFARNTSEELKLWLEKSTEALERLIDDFLRHEPPAALSVGPEKTLIVSSGKVRGGL